ncbi:ABC transporter ATP-binding protein [Fluviibacterium sp. DFM31]|uniref:ABC transporter ATP-binding protein n=1 Tax=Meridianimarinicoccus marinus TaxID=3231483 RepID=A0ABV3L8B9_9RHOB
MADMVLETRDLTVQFGGHVAVDRISTGFRAGELTAIVGPNGAGKTTYFNLISGQIAATRGRVLLEGRNITRKPASIRTRMGLGRGFQLTNLFPDLTVYENVRLVVQAHQRKGGRLLRLADSDGHMRDMTHQALEQVQMRAQADKPVSELPHGDQRKLEVAMLIAMDPKVYMFDEPTAGMSPDDAPVVLDLIARLSQDRSKCILLVEHKMDVIGALADRIIVLHNGALVADGAPQDVMASAIVQEAYMGRAQANV